MQSEEAPPCTGSSEGLRVDISTKEMDLHRIGRFDPRNTMYRWDCGNFPYYKVPFPVNPPSSSSTSSSIGVPCSGSPHAHFPGANPHSGTDVYCAARPPFYAEGHVYFPQPERCACNPHEPQYLPHHNPQVVHWDSASRLGCPCCGQHVLHPMGTADSARLIYTAPVRRSLPDGVLANSILQESIDDKRSDTPVQCLPASSPETSTDRLQNFGPNTLVEELVGCEHNPSNPSSLHTEKPIHVLASETTVLSKTQEKKKFVNSELIAKDLKSENPENPMTNVRLESSVEEPAEKRTTPARKVISASPILQSAQNQALKSASRNSLQVTPLYGRPSWWGDEPEEEVGLQWTYSPLTVSSSGSSSFPNSTSFSSSFSSGPHQKRKSDSAATQASVCVSSGGSDTIPSTPQGLSEIGSKVSPTGGDTNVKLVDRQLPELPLKKCGRSNVSEVSSHLKVEGNTPLEEAKILRHSPPERDSGCGGTQRFIYPDSAAPNALFARGDIRLIHSPESESSFTRCRAPTAFIVDLEHNPGHGPGIHRITSDSRLSEFLPKRCEISLRRRLSWMKRMHEKHRPSTDGGQDGSTGNQEPEDKRHHFKSKDSQSLKDSFDDVITNDAIADDVSDAGTYTIDVGSDSESMGIFDASERIGTELEITDLCDERLDAGDWCDLKDGKTRNFETSLNHLSAKSNKVPPQSNDARGTDEDSDADPGTPTAKSSFIALNDFKNDEKTCPDAVEKEKPTSDQDKISKYIVSNTDQLVLTLYTESPQDSPVSRRTERKGMNENFRKITKNSARSVRSLDTAVLLAEDDGNFEPHAACETWRSQVSVDTGILLQDPEVFTYSKSDQSKLRHNDSPKSSPVSRHKLHLSQSSVVVSDSGGSVVPIEKPPMLSQSNVTMSLASNGTMSNNLDYRVLALESPTHKGFTEVSESGDSLETCGSSSFNDFSPRTDNSLDTHVLLSDGLNKKPNNNEMRTSIHRLSDGNSLSSRSDFDEDGSSVDPLDDLTSVRSVTSLTTEVLMKPTEEFVHIIDNSKTQRQRKLLDEQNRATQGLRQEQSPETYDTTSEMSSSRSVTVEQSKRRASGGRQLKENSSVASDKSSSSRPPKTKPPTPKSYPKASPPPPNYLLSTRRCFSDLDVADHEERVGNNISNVTHEGKAVAPKAAANSTIENTRMNRTFALRCARREASDASETPRSEVSGCNQRYNRSTKKSGASKFDEVQRSRSASRTRPSTTSARSLLDSPRSTDTHFSLGQRIVRKSQENEKKSLPPNTEHSSFSRYDDSSSTTSQKSTPNFRAPNASTKKKTRSDHGKTDASNGPQGLAVRGNTVPSYPQTVSSSASLPDGSSNEWMRRKKYSPKQSLKAEISTKKSGKQDIQLTDGKVSHTKLDQRAKNWKKAGESNSLRSAPSTSSDWTDDEKLQLTPPVRDLPAVCQLSAKVKLLSDQVLQALRKRPEYKVNETLLQSAAQKSSNLDSLDVSSPEFLYIFHNLQAAERQLSDIFQVLSSPN